MAVAAYTFESKARGTSKGRGKRHWFWLHVCWDTSKILKRGAENTEKSIWEPSLKSVGAHTHTHTFYHSWQILGTSHQKGAIKVWCVQFSKRLWPSHQLAATHCARRAKGRVHHRAACEIKQKICHRFSISKWPEGSRSVLCPVSNLCTAVSLSSAGWLVLCTRGQSCSLRDQVQIQSSFFSHTVWLSNRTKITLESGSSADKRFRTDLKIFNKNCITYVSQADVQSEWWWVH